MVSTATSSSNPHRSFFVKHPRNTQRTRRPLIAVVVLLAVLLVAVSVVSVMVGARLIPLPEIINAILHPDPTNVSSTIVWDRRIPRTLLAIVAGMSLGLAGTLSQALTRNPLADTGALGINSGAAFAIVVGIALFGASSSWVFLALALAGACAAAAVVYSVGTHRSATADPVRLVLAGVALSAILSGIGEGLSLVNPQAFDRLKSWMVGSVDVGTLTPLGIAGAGLACGVVLTITCAHGLNALALGDAMATSIGASTARIRFISFIAVVILAASATAAAGVIIFLGLMVPHVARWIVGPDLPRVLTTSLLLGPLVLVVADIIGRLIVPGEFPAGVVVSFIGAPFLIAYAQSRKGEM
ncbi:iron chelate uptake ABC transporter family permease subunit [Corynebacterium ulcerans]|uniref:iron chelate uptake ABC transporter family permease subunit n=1 Tax=Corynebacterium ulcerans TaxID=65058 RepID=UPI00021415CB|nr:iron chelate uptake ABC transporter family permease subunit [Corynebacterium ulcerans]AEG82762.1 integral membrane protein [Corynebacterium ulcerans BR-AD22]NOL58836.1 iron chelate uptake ABC transporter family permease subunit [Corynebacterium ulcerans]NOM03363.1 iron chelate uptake ABC transporter family permease subunit [Corynebacterium ulcerans]